MAAAASSSSTTYYEIPWVEKYRPTKVADVVGNADAISRLQVIARDGNMPNLILSVTNPKNPSTSPQKICYFTPRILKLHLFVQGPPGTGKTTSILALAHELLGPNCKEAVLELNASDDRYPKEISFFFFCYWFI